MDKYFVAAIAAAKDLGNKRLQHLLEIFGSGQAIWHAKAVDLKNAGLPKNALASLVNWRQTNPDAPERLADYCQRKGFGLCSFVDEDYPPLLKEISAPPMFFYYRGKLMPNVERVGIVGTRKNTDYGKGITLALSRELAAAGLTVVSGAARGIDSFAHRGALETGRTVAVLGYGLNWVYPRENKHLLEEIAERGLVMSEFSPNIKANEGTFPTRNRIIAGLCRAVIVVEAGEKSGALITSDFALDEGREVFCIPGSVHWEKSAGCNKLIYEGAKLIRDARDVLEFYNIKAASQLTLPLLSSTSQGELSLPSKVETSPPKVKLSAVEAKILELIPQDEFVTDDEILDQVDDVLPHELPKILIELDVKGYIVEDAGRYTRKFGG